MHSSEKYGHPGQQVLAFLLMIAFASVCLILIPEVYDSTFLKTSILLIFSGLIVVITPFRQPQTTILTLGFTPLHIVFVLFIIISVISAFNAIQFIKALEACIVISCYFIFFSSASVFRNDTFERQFHFVIVSIVLLTSAIGIIQIALPESSRLFFSAGTQEPISTFGNKSYFAGFITLFLPIVAAIGLSNKRLTFLSIVSTVLVMVMLFLLIKTESRTSWFAAGITLFGFLFMNVQSSSKRRYLIGATGIFITLLLLLFPEIISRRLTGMFDISSTSTFSRRLFFYEAAWKAFLASPVFGNGTGNFGLFLPAFRSPDYWMSKSEDVVPHAHNEYLEILSETGVPGLLMFVGFLILFFRYAIRSFHNLSGKKRTLFLGMLCGMAGVLIDGMASMNLRTIPVAAGFWLIAGISVKYMNLPPTIKTFTAPVWFRYARYIPALLFAGGLIWYIPRVIDRYQAEREYLAGIVYKYQGNLTAASSKFSETLRFDPFHSEARLYLAANFIDQRQFKSGYDQLGILFSYNPYIPKGHLLRAVCALELGRTDEAAKELDVELRLTSNPQSLYYASYIAGRTNQAEKEKHYLITLLEKSIAGNSNEFVPLAIQRLGQICGSGYHPDCGSIVKQIVEKFQDTPSVVFSAVEFFKSTGNPTEANRLIDIGLELQTLNSDQRQQLQQLYTR